MTCYDRHLAWRWLTTLTKVLVALVLLFVLVDVLTRSQDEITRHRIPIGVVALYYLAMTPTILFEYLTAGLAVLIAGVIVLGRAAQFQELTALMAGGVSLGRIARAPILLSFALALGALAFNETVGVRAAALKTRIDQDYFGRQTVDPRAGVSWTGLSDGWTCHILQFNRVALTGQDVYLHLRRPEQVVEIRADRIYWDASRGRWLIEDGRRFSFNPDADWVYEVERITQAPAPFTEAPEALFALDAPAETKPFPALAADLRRAESLGAPVARHWVDYHLKFARPALCFVMIWLAIPFAARMRRGGAALGFGLSLAIGVAYVLVFYAGIGLGHIERVPPAVAAWLANGVFLALGLAMFWRTPT